MMGVVLSACVQCATNCHDQYNDWKYTDCGVPTDVHNQGQKSGLKLSRRLTSSIFVAVQDGDVTEVLRHVESDDSCLASCLNNHHESPLHLACRLGYGNIVMCLMEHDCPVNTVTDVGSPLHSLIKAVKCGYIAVEAGLRLMWNLVDRGCDVNATDRNGKTALYDAVTACLEQFIRGLLLLGANPDIAENQYNFTCLHMATYQGNLKCVLTLLEKKGLMLNARDNLNRTPVILAMLNVLEYVQHQPWPSLLYTTDTSCEKAVLQKCYKRTAVVEALVTAGADLNLVDSHDRNPMVIAHTLLAMELLRYGKLMGCDPEGCQDQLRDVSTKKTAVVQDSLFAPMIRLLVMFGARFPSTHPEISFMRCADWMRKMYEDDPSAGDYRNHKQPSRLVNLCRLTIRQQMGRVSKLQCIECLPLPSHLIAYVQIKYI